MLDHRVAAHGDEGWLYLYHSLRFIDTFKDFAAAARLLEPLCEQEGVPSPALRSAIARIYLQSGNLGMAAHHFTIVSADPNTPASVRDMNTSLMAAEEGDWAQAGEVLQSSVLVENPDNYVAVNNLCVALLSQGKLKEARILLGIRLGLNVHLGN